MNFLLCDPGWYVHKSDAQNKWDDNTQHTHRYCTYHNTGTVLENLELYHRQYCTALNVCVCVLMPFILGVRLFLTYQPGSHRRKVT